MNEFGLPVVIHLRNRNPDYGYDEAALFIRDIAAQSPNVMLQLAHIGGWGDYDAQTDGAIRAFLDAIEKGALDRSRVWFDLAAVVLPESPGSYASLPERMRDIGFDRLLFGTDWDEFEPLAYREMLRRTLSLSEGEWDELFGNEAPYLRRTD